MSKTTTKSGKAKSNEEILAGFQALRVEQRQIANKISELEMDLNEHKIVVETLRGVEGGRRCFRLVGGVLVERTVADVLPELQDNCERLPAALATLNDQLTCKGREINDYIECHDIRVQRAETGTAADDTRPGCEDGAQHQANVLVASD